LDERDSAQTPSFITINTIWLTIENCGTQFQFWNAPKIIKMPEKSWPSVDDSLHQAAYQAAKQLAILCFPSLITKT
jgi:hypothetical protein